MDPYILPAGLAVVALAGFLVYRTVRLLKEAVRTRGTVIHVETRYDRQEETTKFTPIVQFTDLEGRDIVFKSRVSSSNTTYFPGADIGILYRAERPDKARIDTLFSLWGVPAIIGGLGVVLVYAGVTGTP